MRTNRGFAYVVSVVFSLLPASVAHSNGDPYGTPKRYCEDVAHDANVHDFGPGSGFFMAGSAVYFQDDVAPPSNSSRLPGTPAEARFLLGNVVSDGSLEDCPYGVNAGNPTFDGHYEFTSGGAILLAGPTSVLCWGLVGDHSEYPTVWAVDTTLPLVNFSIYADMQNNAPPIDPGEPNCGDLESDRGMSCMSHCVALFPPGLDGSYQVYVTGAFGHVWTEELASATASPGAPAYRSG